MNTLTNYIIEEGINESLLEITNCESIDEGRILNGIKKLWNWITRKNKKNKKEEQSNSASIDFDADVSPEKNKEDKKDDVKGNNIEIEEYSLNKLNSVIDSRMTKTKKAIDKKTDQDVKVLVATDTDRKQIVATLVYVNGDKSPIAQKVEKFKNFAHIYSIEVLKEYQELGIGRKLVKVAKEKLQKVSTSQSKGFTIDTKESNSKSMYDNIGFKKPFEDKDLDINILYAKYEDIDTDH